jgi:hypothetical protein
MKRKDSEPPHRFFAYIFGLLLVSLSLMCVVLWVATEQNMPYEPLSVLFATIGGVLIAVAV